jgi:hypothetical protein
MVEPQTGDYLLGHLVLSPQLLKRHYKVGEACSPTGFAEHEVHRVYDFGPCIRAKWPP